MSRLSRIENAQVRIDVQWVRGMPDLYDVGGGRWTELVELAREANQPGWWKAYGLGDNTYIAFETEASRIQDFQMTFVPGLLQTADYAHALMVAVPIQRTAEQLDNEVAARMYCQRRTAPVRLTASASGRPPGPRRSPSRPPGRSGR